MIVLLSVWFGLAGRGSAETYTPKPWRDVYRSLSGHVAPMHGLGVEIGASDNPLCSDCLQIDLDVIENGVAQVRADARALPLADASVEAVFTMDFPWLCGHLFALAPARRSERLAFVRDVIGEYRRVLRPGGRAFLVTGTIDFADGSLEDPLDKMKPHAETLAELGLAWDVVTPHLLTRRFERICEAAPPTDSLDPARALRFEAYLRERFERLASERRRWTSTYLQGLVVTNQTVECQDLLRPGAL